MPRKLVAFATLALLACHHAPPAAPPRPVPAVATPIPKPAEPDAMPAKIGSLERPAALDRFFAQLMQLVNQEATDDLRIVQLGDSHTAADWETGPMRRYLQDRFGDGGRGFVPVGRPWKAWSQEGVLTNVWGEWLTQMNSPSSRHPSGDGVFGLAGYALSTRQPGARATLEVLTEANGLELAYLEHPNGGSFDLIVDGTRTHLSSRGEKTRSAYHSVEMNVALKQHHVEVRAGGDGEVRIFGASLEHGNHGVVVDALGINGARVATPLSWSGEPWSDALRHRAPALVIVAYGTNDAADPETSIDAFEAGMNELLGRITHATPEPVCLVMGPHDRANQTGGQWKTPPRLLEVIARERRAAERARCAFYDRFAAMGGEGAMATWSAEAFPRGQPDRVHLTRQGYADVAQLFVGDIMRSLYAWRRLRDTASSR